MDRGSARLVARLAVVPVLVVRGRDDVLSSADGDRLAGQAADGD